ncbi:MAG: DUF3418 domain-containing protein [Actinomycetaceae bacterium]|nr:DUF3418 domain-containing protein [Actinomycetaceae bacterium]
MAQGRVFRGFGQEQLAKRAASVPILTYPEQLPVSAARTEIMAAIDANQVVIVAGQTGSGKTTQLPKMCLQLGRGIRGLIGHTQPRRLAARTVAERIAEELNTQLGGVIGYQVRFDDISSPQTLVKLMTDGILLNEIQADPLLQRYDTLIIDEAHERSLNIDFILGYVSRLLPLRPDLKVIITSATIDSKRFAAHFSHTTVDVVDDPGPEPSEEASVPVIEVSGRTFPVELRYRPLFPEDDTPVPADQTDSHSHNAPPSERGMAEGEENTDPNQPIMFHLPDELSLRGYSQTDTGIDQVTGILSAVDELLDTAEGDILVFLAGERDIRDTQTALSEHLGPRYLAPGEKATLPGSIEVVPLYSRLSTHEQRRIFQPHPYRRIVLSTNVAETSLTVPGIRCVIDPGLARISRFSTRTKVQRLPIEAISQASANQRAGRCGREAPGVCIRLYSEKDFLGRDEYTEPEILRTSLASVILQMISLGLGEISAFPFIDPPDTRAIKDGLAVLTEIGALDTPRTKERPEEPGKEQGALRLTRIGRQLARLPIDPRLGRMLIEAQANGCASEVMVIVAALSMQDVRERPQAHQGAADAAHNRFTDPSSDFITYVTLWRYLRTQARELSGSAFRRMCRSEFLHYLRVREWQDLVTQLRSVCKPLNLDVHPLRQPSRAELAKAQQENIDVVDVIKAMSGGKNGADRDLIHRSVLVGLLSNLGSWHERKNDYEGARGTHFVIWPGSGLAKRRHSWVMAAELVETSRLFARTCAAIKPEWVEPLATHLLRRIHSEPFWSSARGCAMLHEKVVLYGLTLVADRTITLASLKDSLIADLPARELAREMFIRHALVEGQWRTHHAFVRVNAKRLQEAQEVARRTRELGTITSDEALFEFFETRIPHSCTSARAFDAWWKIARKDTPDLLTYPMELLIPDPLALEGFPDTFQQGDLILPLTYTFARSDVDAQGPHHGAHTQSSRATRSSKKAKTSAPPSFPEGVTLTVPLEVLTRLQTEGLDWGIPGQGLEYCIAVIRALPKPVRKHLVPAPSLGQEIFEGIRHHWAHDPLERPTFFEAFTHEVSRLRDIDIDAQTWQVMLQNLPAHMRMHIVLTQRGGKIIEISDDLPDLQRRFASRAAQAVKSAVKGAIAQAFAEAARENPDIPDKAEAPSEIADNQHASSAPIASEAYSSQILVSWPHLGGEDAIDMELSTFSQGLKVRGYPGLRAARLPAALDRGSEEAGVDGNSKLPVSSTSRTASRVVLPGVELTVFPDAHVQAREHRLGVARLLYHAIALPTLRVTSRWTGSQAAILATSPYPSTEAMVADAQLAAAIDLVDSFVQTQEPSHIDTPNHIRTRAHFDALCSWALDRIEDETHKIMGDLVDACEGRAQLDAAMKKHNSLTLLNLHTELKDQLNTLMYPGFLHDTPRVWLKHIGRYLRASALRLEKATASIHAEERANAPLIALHNALQDAQASFDAGPYRPQRADELTQARWMLEELKVQTFAQQLGTSIKVSAQRIHKLL